MEPVTEKVIQAFIDMIEAKDPYTQGHSHHVKVIVETIFDCLPTAYQNRLDKPNLLQAALLHDIGKIMTPDHILNKGTALNEEEWLIMRQHPGNCRTIIDHSGFAELHDWILYHHERMDGQGYYGLKGEAIPLESRVIAIADTFSALRTYRAYRPAKSIEETIAIMREAGGGQLDEQLLSYFLALDPLFLEKLECHCEICRLRREALEKSPDAALAAGLTYN